MHGKSGWRIGDTGSVPKGCNVEKFVHVRRASLWVPFPFSADKIFTENVCVASEKADGVKQKIQCKVGNGDPLVGHGGRAGMNGCILRCQVWYMGWQVCD